MFMNLPKSCKRILQEIEDIGLVWEEHEPEYDTIPLLLVPTELG